jgi:hypothetical protein
MAALHTLAINTLQTGALLSALPPALHTLHIAGHGGPQLEEMLRALDTNNNNKGSPSSLRDLTLPVIRGDMWRLIARGMPHLTALESLAAIDTQHVMGVGEDEGVTVVEFPALHRFSCSLDRLV